MNLYVKILFMLIICAQSAWAMDHQNDDMKEYHKAAAGLSFLVPKARESDSNVLSADLAESHAREIQREFKDIHFTTDHALLWQRLKKYNNKSRTNDKCQEIGFLFSLLPDFIEYTVYHVGDNAEIDTKLDMITNIIKISLVDTKDDKNLMERWAKYSFSYKADKTGKSLIQNKKELESVILELLNLVIEEKNKPAPIGANAIKKATDKFHLEAFDILLSGLRTPSAQSFSVVIRDNGYCDWAHAYLVEMNKKFPMSNIRMVR